MVQPGNAHSPMSQNFPTRAHTLSTGALTSIGHHDRGVVRSRVLERRRAPARVACPGGGAPCWAGGGGGGAPPWRASPTRGVTDTIPATSAADNLAIWDSRGKCAAGVRDHAA